MVSTTRNHQTLARSIQGCHLRSRWFTCDKSFPVAPVGHFRCFGGTRRHSSDPIQYRNGRIGLPSLSHQLHTLARTITCPSPSTTKSSDIVAQLSTIKLRSRDPLLVTILLTPSLFSWGAPSSDFISSILARTYFPDHQTILEDVQIDVVVAIVDRVSDHRNPEKSDNEVGNGQEGVSFLVCKQKDSLAQSIASQSVSTGSFREDTMTIEQKDCLAIAMTQGRSHRLHFSIPLANTVFQNGQKSTLIASRWLAKAGTNTFILQEEKRLQEYTIEVPEEENYGHFQMSIPLRSLTTARRVAASTGNIIRKLYMDEHETSAVPASQELEKVVTEYFASTNVEAHRVSVWALLWTPEIQQRYMDDLDGETSNLDDIARFIRCGASLHRVLSGGGGWGHKQGLLSIDPDRKYSESNSGESDTEDSRFDDRFDSKRISTGWVEMARPGDLIRFFVADNDYKNPQIVSRLEPVSGEKFSTTTIRFGVMASNLDDMPGISHNSEAAADNTPHLIENLFSAQSYQGISQKIKISGSGAEYANILSQLLSDDTGSEVYETKLDAPFSSVEVRKDVD